MSSAEESYSPGSIATSSTEYSSDYIEYFSSSDEEDMSNKLLFKDELEKKQERKRKRNLRKYKEMCDVSEEEVVPSKKYSHKEDLDLSNKQETETADDSVNTTNVKIKDLEKKANIYTYNINVPKSAAVVIINLKKRDKANTKIICNLANPKLLHQSDTEVIVSNN